MSVGVGLDEINISVGKADCPPNVGGTPQSAEGLRNKKAKRELLPDCFELGHHSFPA